MNSSTHEENRIVPATDTRTVIHELPATDGEMAATDAILDRLDSLHSVPHVCRKILELTRDLDYDIHILSRCVESDPALTAKILRICNSSHYGLTRKLDSIQQALVYFGQRSLRLIALTFSLTEHLTRGLSRDVTQSFWWRAVTMAAIANRLASRHRTRPGDDAYSAGLLADLGILVLAQVMGESYATLSAVTEHGPRLIQAERNRFGCTHPQISARLLKRWDFPESILAACALHHEPDIDGRPLTTRRIQVATVVSDVLWDAASPEFTRALQLLENHAGISPGAFADFATECKTGIQNNAELFRIYLHTTPDCDALRRRADEQLLATATTRSPDDSTINLPDA